MRFGRIFMDIREAWGFRLAFWWRGVGGQLSREEYDELHQALKAARDDFLRWERPETWIADHSKMDTLRSLLARTNDPERPPISRMNNLQVARAICRAIEQGSLIFVPTREDVERYIEEQRKRRRYTVPAGAPAMLDALVAPYASSRRLATEDADEDLEHYIEIVDAKTEAPIEGMTYKLSSDGQCLVYDATLAGGRTRAFSLKEHPNLVFVAWREGDVR